MKISEYKNEDALDLLCDIIEPTATILADKGLAEKIKAKATRIELIKTAIKNHKSEVIYILARLHNVPVEEFECTPTSIIADLIDIFNDEELSNFFTSQAQMMVKNTSGAVTENIEEKEK